MTVTIDDIRKAAALIDGRVVRTPTCPSPSLSELTGTDIVVKLENLQATGAFKVRGALVKLESLGPAERATGVIAMSAGNHAQAVAFHAAALGIPATIVMPETTPFVKIERTEALGADVVLRGETLAETQIAFEAIRAERGQTSVHPYDDDQVIAGQGTIALEMLADEPAIDTIVVPVGGGGLIAGIAVAAKALKPEIEIVGVETALYPSVRDALAGRESVCGGNTLADGIAVKNVAPRTLAVIREHVSEMRLVRETDIERAVNAYLTHQKTVAEGAAAAALAAVMADPDRFRDRKVALVLTGGNIDPRILASIIYRELEREHRIVSLRIHAPDRPGILGDIASRLGRSGANILEVSHHRMFLDVPAKGISLDLMIETRGRPHADRIIADLEANGYAVSLLDAPGGRQFA
jgi:threonine dehydratase